VPLDLVKQPKIAEHFAEKGKPFMLILKAGQIPDLQALCREIMEPRIVDSKGSDLYLKISFGA
jgi:hypothetical protein